MLPLSVEEDTSGISNGHESIEDDMLVPRWDRAPSTSSQDDLPEPPSDCELGEIRHELPTPPQDEELQLLAEQHHDLPPPPPEVFEDLPSPPLDSDSDVPPPPLPPPSASALPEPCAKNTESGNVASNNSFLPTELPSKLTELVTVESQMAAMDIKSVPEEPHLEATCEDSSEMLPPKEDNHRSAAQESLEVPIMSPQPDASVSSPEPNLPPPPPEVIMDAQSALEQSTDLLPLPNKQDINDCPSSTNLYIDEKEHKGTVGDKEETLSLNENLPEAGELLQKLVSSIAQLTKAPEEEDTQAYLFTTEVTPVRGQGDDGDLVRESVESDIVSPSEDAKSEEICSPDSKNAEVPVLSSDISCPGEPPLTSLPRQEPLRPSPSPLKDSSLPPLEAKAVLACPSPLPKPTAIVKPCLPPPPSPPISPCKTADADGVLPPPAAITVMTTLSADSSIVTPIKSQVEAEEEVKEVSHNSAGPVSDFKVTENSSRIEQETLPAKDSRDEMMSEQVSKEEEEEEEEDVPIPPAKGYNLDFLDKLDDPNYNPFETKTAVLNNFDSSAPVSVGETHVKPEATSTPGETEDAPKPETKPKKPPMRKPLARKPLLRKPVKKPEPAEEKPREAPKDEEDDLPAA